MEKEKILQLFQDFLKEYNTYEKDEIWERHSQIFRKFWYEKVLNEKIKELDDFELDSIIKIIDRQARGNTFENEAIAKMLIPQGVWRKMFNQIKEDKKLSGLLMEIMVAKGIEERIKLVDELYKYNEPYKNSLTGKRGNALNALIFLWEPKKSVSIVSLGDRQRLIQFFDFKNGPDFERGTQGEKIVRSNDVLVANFMTYFGVQYSPRTICVFLYHSIFRDLWRSENIGEEDIGRGWSARTNGKHQAETIYPIEEKKSEGHDLSLFYMESQLEDFIIENWDNTDFGKKYELIEEDGEVVSQQYKIDIGRIDILAQDKKTKQLVVIELKKNQTSDDTVGQLARYMGWLEENKTKGKPTKGIIIAAQYDERLYYALKKFPGVEIYLYRVDFRLEEFKKSK